MLVGHFGTSHKSLLGSPSPSCSGQEESTRWAWQAGQAFLMPCTTWAGLTPNGECGSQVEDPKCSSFSFFPLALPACLNCGVVVSWQAWQWCIELQGRREQLLVPQGMMEGGSPMGCSMGQSSWVPDTIPCVSQRCLLIPRGLWASQRFICSVGEMPWPVARKGWTKPPLHSLGQEQSPVQGWPQSSTLGDCRSSLTLDLSSCLYLPPSTSCAGRITVTPLSSLFLWQHLQITCSKGLEWSAPSPGTTHRMNLCMQWSGQELHRGTYPHPWVFLELLMAQPMGKPRARALNWPKATWLQLNGWEMWQSWEEWRDLSHQHYQSPSKDTHHLQDLPLNVEELCVLPMGDIKFQGNLAHKYSH